MSIKVTDTKRISNDFPKLMKQKNNHNLVVLFGEERCGTIIRESESSEHIGFYSKNWNLNDFVDFEGPITLENI